MTEDSSTLDKWLVQQLPAVLLYSASLVSAGIWTSCKWRCQAILAQLRQQLNDAEDYRLTIPHIILTWSYGMSGMSGMRGMSGMNHELWGTLFPASEECFVCTDSSHAISFKAFSFMAIGGHHKPCCRTCQGPQMDACLRAQSWWWFKIIQF